MSDNSATHPQSGPGGYAQALPTLIAFAIWTLIAAALSVPAWHMMGLM